MKQKIQSLLADMNSGLIDREHAIKAAVLTVLAAENLVLIGPPGTAKSMVARRVVQHIQTDTGPHGTASYFEYLLTKFSTPEEIFGPLSISELKADRFRRNTAGYLPTAQVAFLDEIFKASSSILNALLTILNERIFHNGNKPQHVSLRSLISASNELPSGQEELSALYDRFLMRSFVGPVRDDQLHRLFETPGAPHQARAHLTPHDLQAVDAAAQQVSIPPAVGDAIRGIWAAHKETFKEDRREYLSDRRLVKLLKLLRVSAATNHRTEVDLSDAMLLQHCLWNHPDNLDKVREIVITTLQRHSCMVPVDEDSTDGDGVYVVGGDGRQLVQQTPSHRQQPQHPSATAGHTLAVQPKHLSATTSRALSATAAMPPTRTKTKGFAGSGTAQDPIRIGSAEDLISMDDPDIGLAGYHFVQIADIDCKAISHWPSFEFKGHYDGNGKTIRNVNSMETYRSGIPSEIIGKSNMIFVSIKSASSITHLRVDNCGLSEKIQGSQIEYCKSINAHLVGSTSENTEIAYCQVTNSGLVLKDVNDTKIIGCQINSGYLIRGSATASKISQCQAIDGYGLVIGSALNTTISDCAVSMFWKDESFGRDFSGGIVSFFHGKDKFIERCFVSGMFSTQHHNVSFGGISGSIRNGCIQQCAVGLLDLNTSKSTRNFQRIIFNTDSGYYFKLSNNASIDTNPGNDELNGPDGKTVAAARFNQRFFEGSLGWDFDTVWQWDATHNRPVLRFEANDQATDPAASNATAANGTPLQDLLTRQVQANIWL